MVRGQYDRAKDNKRIKLTTSLPSGKLNGIEFLRGMETGITV